MSSADLKDILAACDRLRDDALVDLGVRLEDKPDGMVCLMLCLSGLGCTAQIKVDLLECVPGLDADKTGCCVMLYT
jgi:hypothetical protein